MQVAGVPAPGRFTALVTQAPEINQRLQEGFNDQGATIVDQQFKGMQVDIELYILALLRVAAEIVLAVIQVQGAAQAVSLDQDLRQLADMNLSFGVADQIERQRIVLQWQSSLAPVLKQDLAGDFEQGGTLDEALGDRAAQGRLFGNGLMGRRGGHLARLPKQGEAPYDARTRLSRR
ncbi:hypothetical protein D9M71_572650 [compost metagenome]